MTEPKILEMQARGHFGDDPVYFDTCCECHCEIYEGDEYFMVFDDIVCQACDMEYMKQFKRVAGE